jgi:hypothetical protein
VNALLLVQEAVAVPHSKGLLRLGPSVIGALLRHLSFLQRRTFCWL